MELKLNRIYKHFKGDYYIVEGLALDCETLEECVIYKQLYGDGKQYIRNKKDFLSKVDKIKYPNVLQEYKFELQEIESVRNKK